MKNHKTHRLFQTSLAILALGASGIIVYQNTRGTTKLATATATAGKSRTNLRNLAEHTPYASKPEAPLSDAAPSLKPHLFQEFNDWAVQYAKAAPAEQQQMLAKGETMVKARHEQMAGLIEQSPEVALYESDALSPLAREALPEELKAQLEQPVNARGDLDVIASYGGDAAPYRRAAKLDGQEYAVYPAGNNESYLSESNRSLLGIKLSVNRTTTTEDGKKYPRVDRVIALRKDRVRILSTEEVAVASKALKKGATPTCEVSAKSVTVNQTPAAIETGGDTKWMCSPSHATSWSTSAPGVAAAGNPNAGAGGFWPLPADYATGFKQFLCVPFLCQDQTTSSFTNLDAMIDPMLRRFTEWSFGRITWGYHIRATPLKLPRTVAEYKTGQYDAWGDAQALVAANYGLSQFFAYACCIEGVYTTSSAYMGKKQSLIHSNETKLFLHELGHNLGLPHFNSWKATTADPVGPGSHFEYGGAYDIMADAGGAFNTMSRYYLRWLNVSEIHDLPFRTEGTYTIYDPDVPSLVSGRKYCISIPRTDGSFYFVEFRPNARRYLDGEAVLPPVLNGLRMMRTRGSEQIDLKPLSTDYRINDGRPYNGTLLVGEEFYDAAEGIRVTAIAKRTDGGEQCFDVKVSYTNASVISGHSYMIRSRMDQKMLGVTNSSVANGGPISQQNWQSIPNQKWMLLETSVGSGIYKIFNMNTKKVMEVSNSSMVNGGLVQQWSYVGIACQEWRVVATDGGYFKLLNRQSGRALTVPYPTSQTGIQLQQYTDNTSLNQQWAFDEVTPLTSGSNYSITARHSGKAMNPTGFQDLATVVQWPADNSIYQRWNASTRSGTMQTLINAGTSKALQVGDPNSTIMYGLLDGDKITQKVFDGNAWQLWTTVAVDFSGGDFWYKLVNVGSGLSADVLLGGTQNNDPLTQYTYLGGLNQQWRFTVAP